MADGWLRTDGLGKAFADRGGRGQRRWALRGVDLSVDRGQFVSVIGPSGCGKSTLLELIAGLELPDEGEVWIGEARSGDLLGVAALMPQRDLLMPWRTVLANAALGPELAGAGRAEARALAESNLDRFGLGGHAGSWPDELSVGLRQRAALLRTFLTGRDLLLLDEPFAALDALRRADMQSWLLDVWEQERKTIVFVTHDVEEAIYLSDVVYVMGAAPGTTIARFEVPFSRPRQREELLSSHEFVTARSEVLSRLAGRSGGDV